MKQFPAASYCNFSNGPKQFSQYPISPDNLRRHINLVRIPEEPINYLHFYGQTSFGSPVKILTLSLPTNRNVKLGTIYCRRSPVTSFTSAHLHAFTTNYIAEGHFFIFCALSTLSLIYKVHFFLSLCISVILYNYQPLKLQIVCLSYKG
jgi:hypothetical protein